MPFFQSNSQLTCVIIGLILVDPPIRDTYISLRMRDEVLTIKTPTLPLLGGTHSTLVQHDHMDRGECTTADKSMLDELMRLWTSSPLDGFNSKDITIRELSYFPLQSIATEWVNYLALMCFSLRTYDQHSLTIDSSTVPGELPNADVALLIVSSWPRRVASSLISLRKCVSFIKNHTQPDEPTTSSWTSLREDYEHLTASLSEQGRQFETAIPLVATYAQLTESRRAILEAKSISRLTLLAFIFVPLSFVSGLFSMNDEFMPGGRYFWIYFVVAGPVVLLAALVAIPLRWAKG